MLEINPVLAGTYNQANSMPVAMSSVSGTSAASASDTANGSSGIDERRYTKFDRSTTDFGETTSMSFGDVLDMVNPLQHIPVVSSIYRAATGSTINPVSRVAGDALYGGVFGVASAVMGVFGGAINSMLEEGSGHDGAGTMFASLFGGDTDKTAVPAAVPTTDTTMLASAAPTAPAAAPVTPVATTPADDTMLASALLASNAPAAPQATPAPIMTAEQKLDQLKMQALASADGNPASFTLPATAAAPATAAPIALAAAQPVAPLNQAPPTLARLNNPLSPGTAKAFPLDRTKMAYGGVMAPVGDMRQENLDIGLSQAAHGMRTSNTIYTSQLLNGPHPLPIPVNSNPAAATNTGTVTLSAAPVISQAQAQAVANSGSGTSTATPGRNPLPQGLIDDMMGLRGISQYQNTATGAVKTGSTVDLTN